MHPLAQPDLYIAPSLLAADFSRLAHEIARVESAGARLLHLDVMDGHFVPNISFGVPVIERIRPATSLYFDTHLMIREPARYAESFARAGANGITFHIEVVPNVDGMIDRLRALRVGVGVSLNPRTPIEQLSDLLPRVDLVNVMTVEPGFGGQAFMADMMPKVRWLRQRLRPDQRLEVDGGVNLDTIALAAAAGADTFVAGTAVFGAPDPAAALVELRQRCQQAINEAK